MKKTITAQRIKEIRTSLGKTQADLATEIGYSSNTLSKWERGDGSPPLAVAKLLETWASERGMPSTVSGRRGRDPHHTAILDALNRNLEADRFEACAADLLRREWPTIVPISGGNDEGFDGAVVGQEGKLFPLIIQPTPKAIWKGT